MFRIVGVVAEEGSEFDCGPDRLFVQSLHVCVSLLSRYSAFLRNYTNVRMMRLIRNVPFSTDYAYWLHGHLFQGVTLPLAQLEANAGEAVIENGWIHSEVCCVFSSAGEKVSQLLQSTLLHI